MTRVNVGQSGVEAGQVLAGPGSDQNLLIALWRETLEHQVQDLSNSPEWMRHAAEAAGLGTKLWMLGLRQGSCLVASACYIESYRDMLGVKLRAREMPSDRMVVYHNELVGDACGALLDELACAGRQPCDLIYVPGVPHGSVTRVVLEEAVRRNRWTILAVPGYRSPFIVIAGSWDEYLAAKSSNFRYTLKRKQRAMEKLGTIEERWYESVDSVEELLQRIQQIEASSWKVGAAMSITGSSVEAAYYRSLLPWLAAKGALIANVIAIGGEPAAYSLCYRWHGRIAQMKTSFDEKFADVSPGLVVNASAIRKSFETGAREFDFLGDIMPHKSHWTSVVRPHDNVLIFTRTTRGRLVGWLKKLACRIRPEGPPNTTGRAGHLDLK